MAFLFQVPEGSVVEAIWRCSRGHESPAQLRLETGLSINAYELQIVTATGAKLAVCLQCISEDYACDRVEFGQG